MSLRYFKSTEKRSPVIYKIESPTRNVYIGQTYFFLKRMADHKNKITTKRKDFIVSSIRKHGFHNHKIDIVCSLPKDIDQEILNTYEQFYMDRYRECGFNMMNCRDASSRGKFTEETRKKMSLAQMGNKNNLGKKRPMSEEWKKNIGHGNRGKKNHTEKYKLVLSERMKGNSYTKGMEIMKTRKQISQYSINGEFIKDWNGVNFAADSLGFGRTNLTNCLTGLSKSANGFIWRYKKENN